jgi:cytoskeletal protein CcmA (bactofilin family)
LGPETHFSGVLQFKDSLIITGTFEGTIESSGDLEIEKNAICSVDTIYAQSIVVLGQVTGNLYAPEKIEMKQGCKVIGNVNTGKIRIEDKVEFQGRVTMIEKQSDANLFALSPAQYKESLTLIQNT